jgi:hypothetical protein
VSVAGQSTGPNSCFSAVPIHFYFEPFPLKGDRVISFFGVTNSVNTEAYGRIGCLAFRETTKSEVLEVIAINDLSAPSMLANLLKYDSVHGAFNKRVDHDDQSLIIGGKSVAVYAERDPHKLPGQKHGVDMVLECTGIFGTRQKTSWSISLSFKQARLSFSLSVAKIFFPARNDAFSKCGSSVDPGNDNASVLNSSIATIFLSFLPGFTVVVPGMFPFFVRQIALTGFSQTTGRLPSCSVRNTILFTGFFFIGIEYGLHRTHIIFPAFSLFNYD